MTDSDAAWVEDVKRWCLAGSRPSVAVDPAGASDAMDIGYEAAHPALLARHWPDAPSRFTDSL